MKIIKVKINYFISVSGFGLFYYYYNRHFFKTLKGELTKDYYEILLTSSDKIKQ